jgi:abequosyltransferase
MQATNEVEIVIVDGASTDNTSEVVDRFARRFPRLNYHRLERKGGIDRDMAKSVELARGKYCWLFSADDIMKENALSKILKEVEQDHDIYLCGLTICGLDMKPIEEHPVLEAPAGAEFELKNDRDRADYFAKAKTTTAFFSFCGSLVFKKSRWDEIPIEEEFVGSCWAHVARIFRMIPGGLRIKYLPESLLYKRGDNDSFSDKGIVHRFGIAVRGYNRLADAFFGRNSMEAYNIRRAVRNEYSLTALLYMKMRAHENRNYEDTGLLDRLVAELYHDLTFPNRFHHFAYRAIPVPFLLSAKKTKTWIKSLSSSTGESAG